MTRTTKAEVRAAFERFVRVMGGTENHWQTVDGRNVATPGAYVLDSASCYGGYVVGRICNEGGGEGRPLGHSRLPAAPFVRALDMAADAVILANGHPNGTQEDRARWLTRQLGERLISADVDAEHAASAAAHLRIAQNTNTPYAERSDALKRAAQYLGISDN